MESIVSCPYCGEANTIVIDEFAAADQQYVEDCQVCCQPWQLIVSVRDCGQVDVDVRRAGD